MARIQADNNIEMLLEAFAQAPSHVFVMVGNWNSSAFGREVTARFAGFSNLHLLDAIYDPDELNVLRGHCSIYVPWTLGRGNQPEPGRGDALVASDRRVRCCLQSRHYRRCGTVLRERRGVVGVDR